jgi:hypothetical protein
MFSFWRDKCNVTKHSDVEEVGFVTSRALLTAGKSKRPVSTVLFLQIMFNLLPVFMQ